MLGFIKKLLIKYLKSHTETAKSLSGFFGGRFISNINLDILNKSQKRVLICYLDIQNIDIQNITHPNILQVMVIVKNMIDLGYCIDVCDCSTELALSMTRQKKYDIIIGQGVNYKKECKIHKESTKILFVTESLPSSVQEKYEIRNKYFKKRHTDIKTDDSPARSGYFDDEMFSMSDIAIAMASNYNIEPMRKYINEIYQINCNCFQNNIFVFNEVETSKLISLNKKNFLWFGSKGFIHKGCDILLDAFKEMPELSIDFYGLDKTEEKYFNKLKSPNTYNCGTINVQSAEFIEKVVNKHCFLIFPSCAEGMSTSVATCMIHGIIPIISKETGFEACECIIELSDYTVETIKNTLNKVLQIPEKEILRLKNGCVEYAQKHFTIEHFDKAFRNIIKEITNG